MAFPEERDIKRIINMAGMDEGFFSIAVYSFIEKYMKDFILSKDEYGINEREDKFKEILTIFWAKKFNKKLQINYNRFGNPYHSPISKDANYEILWNFRIGKGMADQVRHNFDYPELDQLQTSITNLISFCKLAGEKNAEKEFAVLNEYLETWNKRENTEDLQKKVDELNKRILQFIESNGNKIRTIEELRAAQEEYENRINELESLASTNSDVTKELEETRKENDLLLEYVESLRQLTAYTKTRKDYENSITRLSLDQMKAVNQFNDEKFYLITGTAGTGKSLILLKLIEKLLVKAEEQKLPGPKYALLTYINSLVKYNKYTADLINTSISENINTVDKIISDTFARKFPRLHFSVNTKPSEDEVKDFLGKYFRNIDVFTRLDAAKELANNIWPNFLTEDDFFSRDLELTCKTSKKDIWEIAKACLELTNLNDIPYDFAVYLLARELEMNPVKEYDYLFVDEVQDLSTGKLVCLKNMTNHLILTGDKNQKIYNYGESWENLKENFEENNYVLSTNFRNTIQINDFAEAYRSLSASSNDELSEIKPKGFRNGPEVEVYHFDSRAINYLPEHFKFIKAKIDLYTEELGYSPDSICILTPHFTDELSKEFSKIGLETEIIKKMDDFNPTGKVKISSINSAKGLSFPVVLFMTGENENITKKTADYENFQRNLYYVAMTRAMDILNVFMISSNDNLPYISDILKIKD